MIDWVSALLSSWGSWVIRQQDGGIGWHRSDSTCREYKAQAMARSPRGPGMQMDNAEVLDTTTRERWVWLGEGLGWRKSYDLR